MSGAAHGAGPDGDGRNQRRRELLRLAATARGLSTRIAVHLCGTARESAAEIWAAEGAAATVHGVRRCGSVWECPECAQRIGLKRREELSRLAIRHRATGGELYHVILTARHARGVDLKAMRRHVARAWQRCTNGNPWKRLQLKIGHAGTVRGLDTTLGEHGWHPHLHVLVLTAAPVHGRELVRFRRWLFDRWSAALLKSVAPGSTLTPPDARNMKTRGRGVRLKRAAMAEYLAEASITWSDELGSHTMKKARGGNRTPWQVLDAIRANRYDAPAERRADIARWRAWAAEIAGARQLTWSRGLRVKYAVDQSDEQTELELAPAPRCRLVVSAWDWRYVVRGAPRLDAALRELAEDFELSDDAAQAIADDWLTEARAGPAERVA